MLHTEYSYCALKTVFKFMIIIKTTQAYIYCSFLILLYVACKHHSLLYTWY